MSFIEVSTIKRDISRHELFSTFVNVQSREDRWEKFPPCVLIKETVPNLHNIRNFKVHADDIFLCGYPRSGATVMQEIIWLIVNDFDFEKARSVVADERFPILESLKDTNIFHDGKVIIYTNDMHRPRTIKTYLPVQFLPDDLYAVKPKIIYLTRSVKEVAISAYHYIVDDLHSYTKLQEFLQDFLDDKIVYTPYWEHLVNFRSIPEYENKLEIEYEWMVENIEDAIRKVADFLDREISDENFAVLRGFIRETNKIKQQKINARRCVMPKEFEEKFEEFMRKASEVKSEFEKHD